MQDTPVRVVRGHKSADSYVGKVYTYDGLYKVAKWNQFVLFVTPVVSVNTVSKFHNLLLHYNGRVVLMFQ